MFFRRRPRLTTPDNIVTLAPNQVFVFGSNLAGKHGGGAAALAERQFGAKWGVGEGITGACYAFPTLGYSYEPLTPDKLREARDRFYREARFYSDKTFLLTKVGCGIAGYPEQEMRRLFRRSPRNIVKPAGW
jgi:hypothetical protein